MELQADTSGGSNGIWSQLLGAAQRTGSDYLNRNRPVASSAPAASAPAASFDFQKYLPLAIGAVVLLVVVGFVFKRK